MQARKHLFAAVLTTVALCTAQPACAADTPPAGQVLYPASSQQRLEGLDDYFTGEVRVDLLFPTNDTARYSGAVVTFQPGARTAWHLHPKGQHMIITAGTGFTGTRDGRIIGFREGDTIWCPPNLDHWHGAAQDSPMTHLVITGSLDGRNVVWKEKVSDAEYRGAGREE